jgi:hypothetical protein
MTQPAFQSKGGMRPASNFVTWHMLASGKEGGQEIKGSLEVGVLLAPVLGLL